MRTAGSGKEGGGGVAVTDGGADFSHSFFHPQRKMDGGARDPGAQPAS